MEKRHKTWLEKARKIRDGLPDIGDDKSSLTDIQRIAPEIAHQYLERNVYGLVYDVPRFLALQEKPKIRLLIKSTPPSPSIRKGDSSAASTS